jgi:hypothetical protein
MVSHAFQRVTFDGVKMASATDTKWARRRLPPERIFDSSGSLVTVWNLHHGGTKPYSQFSWSYCRIIGDE